MRRTLALGLGVVLAGGCGGDDGGGSDIDAPANGDGADPGCAFAPGWSPAPALPLGPTQETATVAVDGKIYVMGGFNGALGVIASVQVFDTAACTWSAGPDLPLAVHHANAAAVDGTIYVLGGMQGLNFRAIGDTWAWNPATDAGWRTLAPMPTGTARGSAVVGVIGTTIYLAGGLNSGAVALVSAYDTAGNRWEQLPPLPEGRDHGCGAAVGGTLYVVGGRRGTTTTIAGDVYAYAPGGTWATRVAMPTPRGGTACGVIDDRIIVAGGEGNPAVPSGVFSEVEAFTPSANAWTTLPPMTTPRHGMGAAAWDGRLYVPGGAVQEGFGADATHEVLTP